MIRLCEICHKPIYSRDETWSNDMGMAVHSACLSGLTINFTTGRISPPRRGEGLTPFDMAYLMIVTMVKE